MGMPSGPLILGCTADRARVDSYRQPNIATSKYYRFHKPEVDAFKNELGADGRSISPETYTEVVQRRKADFVQRMQVGLYSGLGVSLNSDTMG